MKCYHTICSEVCSQVPVEESTHFVCMKTAGFSNTVFDKCPMISTITSFERLPEFTPVSVFEDILDSPVSMSLYSIAQNNSLSQVIF